MWRVFVACLRGMSMWHPHGGGGKGVGGDLGVGGGGVWSVVRGLGWIWMTGCGLGSGVGPLSPGLFASKESVVEGVSMLLWNHSLVLFVGQCVCIPHKYLNA